VKPDDDEHLSHLPKQEQQTKPSPSLQSSLWIGGIVALVFGALVLAGGEKNPNPQVSAEQQRPALKNYAEADFYWDEYNRDFKQEIIRGVNNVARNNERCWALDPSSATTSTSKGTPQNKVFYVTCQTKDNVPFNVFFSESDLKSDQLLSAEKHLSREQAINKCRQWARAQAIVKNSVDFSEFLHLSVVNHPNGRTSVKSRFTVKNTFGTEMEHDVVCLMDASGFFEASISGI
jgi:hypothetical protein